MSRRPGAVHNLLLPAAVGAAEAGEIDFLDGLHTLCRRHRVARAQHKMERGILHEPPLTTRNLPCNVPT